MTRRRLVLVALAALTGAGAACTPSRRGAATREPPAEVEFANESLNQVEVFAVGRGGAQTRIGTVMAGRTELLRISAGTIGAEQSTNVVARIRASGRVVSTGQIRLAPGDRMRVTLSMDERSLMALPVREP
jgi:hypothetical protein